MIKAIIFDCFGVIRPDRLMMTYQKYGGDPEADLQFIEDTIKAANYGMIVASRDVFAKKLGISVETWMGELDSSSDNDEQLLNYIEGLRKTYRTGLLSNASKGRMVEIVGQADLDRCFDAYAESGSMGYAKPEPEAYEIIAERLDARLDECIFTDDREDYCEGACAIGMQAILYKSFPQYKTELEIILAKDGA